MLPEALADLRLDPDEPPWEVRPRSSRGDEVPALSNGDLARILHEVADMLELKGEVPFKVAAYRRAADSVGHCVVDVAAGYRAGHPPRLDGVGRAIDEKLAELADTGRLRSYEHLRREVPPSLAELLEVPGVGPATAGELWRQLGVTSLVDLEQAARNGRVRTVRGMSAKSEARILDSLAELAARPPRRLHMAEAHALAERLATLLATAPGVTAVVPAGSVRRWRETVGDLDLLVVTDRPAEAVARLRSSGAVESRAPAGGLDAGHRASLRLVRGPQVDVMTAPPGHEGTYLVHLTGSAEHNVRLRRLARERGWSLSEHGFTRLDGSGSPGEASTGTSTGAEGQDGQPHRLTFGSEEEVYAFLDLALVPPELREDRGEVEAAATEPLPTLVRTGDLQGDCHTHSDWSDGHESIETMAEAARRRGYAWQVLTDHTRSLTIANGLTPERVEMQRRVIGTLNERFAREAARGEVPEGSHPDGFRLLHGCELEIRTDGRLDYDDDLLSRFDVVVASLHVGRRQPRAELMARYLVAMRSPHVDIIAHPSGRKIGQRPELDLDWDAFFRAAAETGTLLEVNGSDERLDLDEHRARAALDAGCRFTIDSDAHYLSEWDNVRWGAGIARRAWLQPVHVLNTLSLQRFLSHVAEKPGRV